MTGKFTTSGSGRLTQDPLAHVTWIVDKDITVSGEDYQNGSGKAGNLSLTAVGAGKVNITGSSSLIASIYAPSRNVTISGSGGLSGGLFASTLTLGGGSPVHCDEGLISPRAVTILFEGQPPQTAYGVGPYLESEIQFTGQPGLVHNGGGIAGFPDDGGGYLQAVYKMTMQDAHGRSLKLKSIDLAEYSYVYAYPTYVTFVGWKVDGTSVSQILATDGLMDGPGGVPDFQTFTFGDEWSDLLRDRCFKEASPFRSIM